MSHPQHAQTAAARWQAQLLRRVHHMSAEHARLSSIAEKAQKDPRVDGHDRAELAEHLNTVMASLEEAEYKAEIAGIPAAWIEDMRELGRRGAQPAPDIPDRPSTAVPVRDDVRAAFYVEMLGVDVWDLERMAALAAARANRIETGRWSVGTDPLAEQRFAANMARRWERVNVLARAAELTPAEADAMWGASAEGVRRAHAAGVGSYDELFLVQQWSAYATPGEVLAIPPYVPTTPDPGTAPDAATVVAPTPEQMIADARMSLRAHFVDTAIDTHETTGQPAIADAVDAAVADQNPTPDTAQAEHGPQVFEAWSVDTDPVAAPSHHHETGPEH
ncbi:hypothetical protein [Nocardia cyriacigeorgica]|uniref:hypothetical protein n=1 Tax=Nocardia cyriacigeorgica TaxID=135487 RepID=UPI002458068F|nr:hypothetical protein [Nocardia cyriacigeorgica]